MFVVFTHHWCKILSYTLNTLQPLRALHLPSDTEGEPMETRFRTLIKAAIWQLMGLIVMVGVGWALTGSIATGGGIALINTMIGFLTYVFYERLWARIGWGRVPGRYPIRRHRHETATPEA